MIQRFGDYAIDFTDRTSDDEYHQAKTHESNTVSMWAMPLIMFFGAAILAWTLPGWYSMLGVLVIIFCTATSQQAGLQWMKNYAPRPKAVSPTPYMAVAIALLIVIIGGIIWNGALANDRSWPLVLGLLGGAAVGVIIAMITVPRGMASDHDQDTARLEAELED